MTAGQAQLSNEPENVLESGDRAAHQNVGALGEDVSDTYIVAGERK